MPTIDRRRFLQLSGGVAGLSLLPTSIARAAAIPAHRRSGSIADVEHIVVLMQENRSFDHYFGTMRGVRGFGDPHPARLPSGKSVWHQADGTTEVLPFRPDVDDLGLAFLEDLDHEWDGGHQAFNDGKYDQWIPAKSSTTMAHLRRHDMPFHYALADAFTICDNYHCSLLGPTDPNRYYMWTGWVGNDGQGGGPVIANDEIGYGWTTYPERLQDAGISWKVYQDVGVGLDAAGYWGWTDDPYIGNYGDNSLLYFHQYQNATPGSPLYAGARKGTDNTAGQNFFDVLRKDVKNGRLPQVSWIAAPEAFTEHPNWPANYGAWYTANVLDALTSDPEVWAKTVLLITFDENDGFFDHVVPPYPNGPTLPGKSTVPTTNEFYDGQVGTPGGSTGVRGPYGLGQRVPMLAVSPWSSGGWVSSEVFDHTSIIRFIEARFGVSEPNITDWRRAVCGDLTSAFDFSRSTTSAPSLPSTAGYRPADNKRHPDYVPVPPADAAVPVQEPGTRSSRPLGYEFEASSTLAGDKLSVTIANTGRLGVQLQARSAAAPRSFTVGAHSSLTARWAASAGYDVELHAVNGFYRRFAGAGAHPQLEVTPTQDSASRTVTLRLANHGTVPAHVRVRNAYDAAAKPIAFTVVAGKARTVVVDTADLHGWYDLAVIVVGDSQYLRQFAGRIENGTAGVSDPRLGAAHQ